jgi:hypothetical protein
MAGDIGTDGATTTVGGEAAAITMVGGTIAIGAECIDPTCEGAAPTGDSFKAARRSEQLYD